MTALYDNVRDDFFESEEYDKMFAEHHLNRLQNLNMENKKTNRRKL